MSPLEPLAPDQRAVVTLVLQQGRSYDEIAAMLGIPVDAVRARAHAGLAGLVPQNGLPREITGPLADYLLGQQPERDAEATRGLLAESAPARDWASGVAGALADVAPGPLPEIPGAPAEPTRRRPPRRRRRRHRAGRPMRCRAGAAPRRRPARPRRRAAHDGAPPPASRLGGLLLIGAVFVVVAVVLFLVLRGGDDDPATEQSATATATATATPTTATAASPGHRRDPAARRRRRQGEGHDDRLPAGRAAAVRAPGHTSRPAVTRTRTRSG